MPDDQQTRALQPAGPVDHGGEGRPEERGRDELVHRELRSVRGDRRAAGRPGVTHQACIDCTHENLVEHVENDFGWLR